MYSKFRVRRTDGRDVDSLQSELLLYSGIGDESSFLWWDFTGRALPDGTDGTSLLSLDDGPMAAPADFLL